MWMWSEWKPQWGHGVTAMETRPQRQHPHPHQPTAMGPRRHRRGDPTETAEFVMEVLVPQWVHAVTAVETRVLGRDSFPARITAMGRWRPAIRCGMPSTTTDRNGATASPPWRLSTSWIRSRPATPPQWGHGVTAVETRRDQTQRR